MAQLVMVTRSRVGDPPLDAEAEPAALEVHGDELTLTLDDGVQLVLSEEEFDRAIGGERQAARRVA